MSVQIPLSSFPIQVSQPNPERRSAGFQPSIWGDHFLSYASSHSSHGELKEEVRRMLMAKVDEVSEKLQLIDAIQLLGIAYHFESEISKILTDINSSFNQSSDDSHMGNSLYIISLTFRLLRNQGFRVSCGTLADVFNKFKDSQGKFKEILKGDIEGMLACMRLHISGSPLSAQIRHALKQPIRKNIPRLQARHYFTVYQEQAWCDGTLLYFAKLDFNLLQQMHQKELSDISKWWKELDFPKKLPFARDRLIECYFWILRVYFEPEYDLARRILTKVIAMTSVMDDIYDVYGTPEELELFTEAIERWDEAPAEELPEYMKIYYKAQIDVYSEIEENMANEEISYRVYYAKEAMKKQARAYFLESKWLQKDEPPTMEEYLSIALVSSGYPLLATTSFIGMGNANRELFDWLCGEPKVLTASTVVCRLMDDMVSHKLEQKRGHVASAVECYMKQHGVTEEETKQEFRRRVVQAWKHINEECLRPTPVPLPFLTLILNLTRVIDVVYKEEDGYTHAPTVLKDFVSSVLIHPVPL
ncbi:hypothetical protein Tsubulata_039538 [Turnera subulata]|uniref:Uncharacterized protein n=1 Tax=Turnera subulata TaxID=218843 RepID=A0A9Q0FH01_9ROSI|nr:hypothetical protein Tsubulata_039538 [Turnera subulata]